MRKVILSMLTSIDGFTEAPGHDINWHVFDEEMSEFMLEFFKTVDTFLYGRKSYELMLQYWPDQKGEFAEIMNHTPKVVFSKTLENVVWNARLVKDDVAMEVNLMKHKEGKDMVLFAGADIASTFIKKDLIDEYRIIVNPVVLGEGTPLFKSIRKKMDLKLVDYQSFNCGNILLIYHPKKSLD